MKLKKITSFHNVVWTVYNVNKMNLAIVMCCWPLITTLKMVTQFTGTVDFIQKNVQSNEQRREHFKYI